MTEINKKENYVIDTDGGRWDFRPEEGLAYSPCKNGFEPAYPSDSFEEMINQLISMRLLSSIGAINVGDMVKVKSHYLLPFPADETQLNPCLVLKMTSLCNFIIQLAPALPGFAGDDSLKNCPGFLKDSMHFQSSPERLLLVKIKEEEVRSEYYESPSGFQTNDDNWKNGLGLL